MTDNRKFNGQISDFVRKSETRMIAVVRQSAHDVFEDAQVSTAKGGRMRVDTGFLRNSGQVSLTGLPSGPERLEEGMPIPANIKGSTVSWQPRRGPIWFGWTASYARAREYHDGFMVEAAKKWQQFINKNTAEIKRRLR